MLSKNECLEKFRVFCAQVRTPKVLCKDTSTKYTAETFLDFCFRRKRESSASNSPFQNGVRERYSRITVEMPRCQHKQANIGNDFWVKFLYTAFYVTSC